jgi:hypothetical protein
LHNLAHGFTYAQEQGTLAPRLGPDKAVLFVEDAHARFEQSRIRDFVPLFVERRARAELAKLREKEPIAASH